MNIAMFDGLITPHEPSLDRTRLAEGGVERLLTEGAVMVAFAMHLLRTAPGISRVTIHPDGEHGKRFQFSAWLGTQGFQMVEALGATRYGGLYRSHDGREIVVNPKSGLGEVVAGTGSQTYLAECKGGVVNSRHAGQLSRLRKGLCETIGQSLSIPFDRDRRQFAVVPRTPATVALASRLAERALHAGVEIALVDERGNVHNVRRRSFSEPNQPDTLRDQASAVRSAL